MGRTLHVAYDFITMCPSDVVLSEMPGKMRGICCGHRVLAQGTAGAELWPLSLATAS